MSGVSEFRFWRVFIRMLMLVVFGGVEERVMFVFFFIGFCVFRIFYNKRVIFVIRKINILELFLFWEK